MRSSTSGGSNGLRDELRWLGDELGAVRDTEVLIERLESNVPSLPEVDRAAAELVIDRLGATREAARDAAPRADCGASGTTRCSTDSSASQRATPAVARDDGDDAELTRDPWSPPVATAARRGRTRSAPIRPTTPCTTSASAPSALATRPRRSRPAVGKPARRASRRVLVDVQDVLGEHQDAVIAGEWLRRAAAQSDHGHEAFAAGQLAALEREAAQTSRDAWPATWERADRKRLRSWL